MKILLIMPRKRKSPVPQNKNVYCVDRERTYEEKLEFVKYMWQLLGIPGTPTRDDVINRASAEKETILMIRKFYK